MKRKQLVAGLALGVALLVLVIVRRGSGPRHESLRSDSARVAEEADPPFEPAPSVGSVPSPTRSPIRAEPASELAAGETIESGPRCRVIGRVVDERGAPLAGVAISMRSVREPWVAGREELSYEVSTQSDGRFEIEAQVPTSEWITLWIHPSRFHSEVGKNFGPAGRGNQDPLREGDNDLGTFALLATGAIEGTVRARDGSSIEGAVVRLKDAYSGSYLLSGMSGPAGAWAIEHVPAGRYEFEAMAMGYLSSTGPAFNVEKERVARGPDFELERAPEIAGRVVDQEGRPLEGVCIQGRPVNGGRGADVETGPDGSFVIALPQDQAYRLHPEKEGYEPASGAPARADRSAGFLPGANDVELVMHAAVETIFRAVDARTLRPVERFGLRVETRAFEGWSTRVSDEEIQCDDAPDGQYAAFARPERDEYSIQAPGYAPQHGRVLHDSADMPLQVVRLEPEGRMRARILLGGVPVQQAVVRVHGFDLDAFTGRRRRLTTNEEGVLEVGELASGTYRLEVKAPGASPWAKESLPVTAGETLDLGDVELEAGATVRGRVVLGSGAQGAGLTVFLGDPWHEVQRLVGADGTFEFGGLAAGAHQLSVGDHPGVVLDMEPFDFEIGTGETKDVLLDLTPWHPCSLHVRVVERGVGVSGVEIQHVPGSGHSRTLGFSDENGVIETECPPDGAARFALVTSSGLFLAITRKARELPPGGFVEFEFPIETGAVTLVFPEAFDLPPSSLAHVSLISGAEVDPVSQTVVHRGDLPFSMNGVRWMGPRVELGRIRPDGYKIEVQVSTLHERAWEDGVSFIGEVMVSPGTSASCTLRAR